MPVTPCCPQQKTKAFVEIKVGSIVSAFKGSYKDITLMEFLKKTAHKIG